MERKDNLPKIWNKDVRRRYLLQQFHIDVPRDVFLLNEYEAAYFADSAEFRDLEKEESRLAYEYALGLLSEPNRISLENAIITMKGLEEKAKEAKKLSQKELEQKLIDLDKK